jgi:hypothetical protein
MRARQSPLSNQVFGFCWDGRGACRRTSIVANAPAGFDAWQDKQRDLFKPARVFEQCAASRFRSAREYARDYPRSRPCSLHAFGALLFPRAQYGYDESRLRRRCGVLIFTTSVERASGRIDCNRVARTPRDSRL